MVNPLEAAALLEETLPVATRLGTELFEVSGVIPKVMAVVGRSAPEAGGAAIKEALTGEGAAAVAKKALSGEAATFSNLSHRVPFSFDKSVLPADRNSLQFQESVARQLGLDPEKLGGGKVAILHHRLDQGVPDLSFASAKHEVAVWGSREQGLGVVEYKSLPSNRGYLSSSDSVVRITKTLSPSTPVGQADRAASGVIVKGNGVIATNEHVVRDAQSLTVEMQDGQVFAADVLHADTANDLALIKVSGAPVGHKFPVPRFTDPGTLWKNARVAAVGHQGGLRGLVASPGVFEEMSGWGKGVYSIDGAFSGVSGSGVFDNSGDLVGLTAKLNPAIARRASGPSADLIRRAIMQWAR